MFINFNIKKIGGEGTEHRKVNVCACELKIFVSIFKQTKQNIIGSYSMNIESELKLE